MILSDGIDDLRPVRVPSGYRATFQSITTSEKKPGFSYFLDRMVASVRFYTALTGNLFLG
jgi:hypothetical protein